MQATEQTTETAVSTPKRTLKTYVGLTLRGMAMGASDIVPGVSGGTMALILGIYEELIGSIRTLGRPEFLRPALRLQLKQAFLVLNWRFLLAVGLGIFTAIVTLSGALEWLLVHQTVYIWSFFFGLVLASAYTVSQRIPQWTAPLILTLLVGTAVAFFIVGLVPAQTPNTWWFLFLSGMLASCAMMLPGISGAFILFILGKYEYVLAAVNTRDFVTLALVAAGAAVGLVTFAQVLSWLFKRYHDLTVAVLIGLMVGSLRKLWPWRVDVAWLTDSSGDYVLDRHGELLVTQQINVLPDLSTQAGVTEFIIAAGLAIIGMVVILVLERVAR
jgi:putative membrane protein